MDKLPISDGITILIIHKSKDAATIPFVSLLMVPKKKLAVAPRTIISVSANVGMALVTTKVRAMRQKRMVSPALIPNIFKTI